MAGSLEPLARGQVRLRVHGPDPATDELSASVFADKMLSLVRAFRAADKAVNGGKPIHDYMISRLVSSTPTAVLIERPLPRYKDQFITGHSGILGFQSCVDAITSGERERALSYGDCAKFVGRLTKGSHTRFRYAEVWTDSDSVVRVDPFLSERVRAVVSDEAAIAAPSAIIEAPISDWFEGKAIGTFDGEVRAVDLRGSLPELKLILSAGGKQMDCVCRSVDIESIRDSLNRRVRLSGTAIYDGRSGLPRRLEVSSIETIATGVDISSWKGSFDAFDLDDWGDEDV